MRAASNPEYKKHMEIAMQHLRDGTISTKAEAVKFVRDMCPKDGGEQV